MVHEKRTVQFLKYATHENQHNYLIGTLWHDRHVYYAFILKHTPDKQILDVVALTSEKKVDLLRLHLDTRLQLHLLPTDRKDWFKHRELKYVNKIKV